LFIAVSLAVTHQITPYLVTLAVLILVLLKLCRPWWLPIAVVAPAVVWALINITQVRKYFNVGTVGNIGGNISTPGSKIAGEHKLAAQLLSQYSLALGLVLIGVLAIGAFLQQRSRSRLGVIACAASSGALVVATNYGNEGIFRVALFALPWLCVGAVTVKVGRAWLAVGEPALIAVLCGTYLFGDLGLDAIVVDRPGMVISELLFESSAPAGSLLLTMGNYEVPKNLTAAYPNLHFGVYKGIGELNFQSFMTEVLPSLHVFRGGKLFIEYTEAAMDYGELEGICSAASYRRYEATTLSSPDWTLLHRGGGSLLFRFQG
jgi:hypothetical protein